MAILTSHEARAEFAEVLNRAAYKGERTRITRRGKVMAAVVSAEDLELLERVEDQLDVAEAREVLARLASGDEQAMPLERVLEELGLP